MDEYTKDLYTMMFSLQTLLCKIRELQSEKLYIKVWTNYCYGIKNLKTVNISN